MNCPAGSVFLPDASIGNNEGIAIFWVGRNTSSTYSPAWASQFKADIAAMIANLKSPLQRFIVLSILNSNIATEYAGGPDYASIIQLNNDLSALYPGNYVDVRSALVAAYNPSIAQDVIDHAGDVPPSSLRADYVHLVFAGYIIVATKIRDFIVAKAW